jgi:hypothetical protein
MNNNNNETECPICKEKFYNEINYYRLDCDHIFHLQCIKNAIKYKHTCPLCRTDMMYLFERLLINVVYKYEPEIEVHNPIKIIPKEPKERRLLKNIEKYGKY